METLKIKSTHKESQGDFVLINAEDFNAETMEIYNDAVPVEVETAEKVTRSKK